MCAADVDTDEVRRLLDALWRKNRDAVLERLARVRAAVDVGDVLDDDVAEDLHALVGTLGTYGWSGAARQIERLSQTIGTPTVDRSAVLRQLDDLRAGLAESADVPRRAERRHVLAVDDQPEIRDVIRLAIESTTDWSVTTCADVTAAVHAATATPPDVVLLDVHMAGQAVERSVREVRRHIDGPIILLTGTPLTSADIQLAGADGLLTKPFDPLQLAADIERIMARD